MSWKEILIFVVGAIFGKVLQDSLPVMDVRPGLRRVLKYIVVRLGIILAVLSLLRFKNSAQLIVTLIVAVPLIALISEILRWQIEKTAKNINE